MRKVLKLLAVTACTAALCGTLAGCGADENMVVSENPVKTVYIYLPDGTLLDSGKLDSMKSVGYNTQVIVRMHGKKYTTSWANAVLVEE